MKRARVIPVLLLKNTGLYKTVRFTNEKYIGDPINAVRIFNEKQCDELIFLDISSTKEGKEIDYRHLSEITEECFMPFAYGGGIKDLHQIERLLKMGIEKVVLNTVLFTNTSFLKNAVRQFGSSTIVASVDVKYNFLRKYTVSSHAGIDVRSFDLISFIKSIEEDGAGEIMINNVDLDGTMKGYDIDLAALISDKITPPLVFCGGCSGFDDIKNLLTSTNVSAAAAGSIFVYHGPLKGVLINYPSPEEISGIYDSPN